MDILIFYQSQILVRFFYYLTFSFLWNVEFVMRLKNGLRKKTIKTILLIMNDKEKIEEVLRLLDKILRAKKEEYGFSYPELNSGLVHGHFIKIKKILEK